MPNPANLPPAIISTPGVTPTKAFAWASALDDLAAPKPIRGADRVAARAQAEAVRAYLDVEKPAHVRYLKQKVNEKTQTFCNVYAFDAATLSGAYLALVWWTRPALRDIAAGVAVKPRIGDKNEGTVTALKANLLYDWFVEHAASFGWTRVARIVEAQRRANDGEFVIIIARGKTITKGRANPGHIAWVVEELGAEVADTHDESTFVPTISQAGSKNLRQSTTRGRWWAKPNYEAFGFWAHPGSRA